MAPSEPSSRSLTPEQTRRKKRFEKFVLILMALGLLLLILVQRRLLNLGPGLSSNQGVITLVSINFSLLVLGFLLFLILRGLYRVFFERHDYGSLRTKMAVSFIGLSLLPTLMIFYFAYLLIGQDHDTWFGASIKETMKDSLALAESSLEMDRRQLISFGEGIIIDLLAQDWDWFHPDSQISAFLAQNPDRDLLKAIEWYDQAGQLVTRVGDQPEGSPWPATWLLSLDTGARDSSPPLTNSPSRNSPSTSSPSASHPVSQDPNGHDLAWRLEHNGHLVGFLVLYSLRGDFLQAQYNEVRQGLAKYQLAIGIKRPFRVSQLMSLAGVTLLAVFFSIWIGSRLANSLSSPITELVAATRRVAKGELDFILTPRQSGELAHLVTAFNQMTQELKASYSEIDSRRRFVETVLKEVSNGVVVVNPARQVVTINQAAQDMLKLTMSQTLGQLPAPVATLLGTTRGSSPRARVYVETAGRTLSLIVSRHDLRDEEGSPMGALLTFDDLSELEKAQRLAAWREVARRIAHEVKNPLTPISLAAQRLLRRFSERLDQEGEGKIFRECVEIIIRQVENMRTLVDEFSQFARLPQINPRPADLVAVVEESLALFRQAHPDLDLRFSVKKPVGTLIFDPEQIGRVIANLLTNSTQATQGQGLVEITIDLDELVGVAITVADDGPGLPAEVKERVFEPYVTHGQGGQGLGLAIVKAIINDHGGFIRVNDRQPRGTVFAIHLPLARP
ncbi:MAG: HAMP domain-containing protein [Deltaproteobacteria bacterium]|jgi:two-component system nitrogen regulation sensor histidine kinase NtrY|nr:HAMP domain-containing protein [Deltaproteobacteria bacterium]